MVPPRGTLRDLFGAARRVTYDAGAPQVVATVAACIAEELAPGAAVGSISPGESLPRNARIHVGAGASPAGDRDDEPCLRLRLDADGRCELQASRTEWLYALFCWCVTSGLTGAQLSGQSAPRSRGSGT